MSVLISGLNLPNDKPVTLFITSNRNVYLEGVLLSGKAVPVPPHGKLGDLDRILEIIDGIWDCNDMTFKPNDHCCDVPKDCHGCKWAETKRAIREIVANAPTIIPPSGGKEDE